MLEGNTGYQIQEEIINKKNKWRKKNPAMRIHSQKWDGQLGATIYQKKISQDEDVHAMQKNFLEQMTVYHYAVHVTIVISTSE